MHKNALFSKLKKIKKILRREGHSPENTHSLGAFVASILKPSALVLHFFYDNSDPVDNACFVIRRVIDE